MVNEIEQLELLSESIQNEINELRTLLEHSDSYLLKAKRNKFQKQLENIISNLESANDGVYGVFEDLYSEDMEKLQQDYNILHDILNEKLSHEDKVYIRLKHGIEF